MNWDCIRHCVFVGENDDRRGAMPLFLISNIAKLNKINLTLYSSIILSYLFSHFLHFQTSPISRSVEVASACRHSICEIPHYSLPLQSFRSIGRLCASWRPIQAPKIFCSISRSRGHLKGFKKSIRGLEGTEIRMVSLEVTLVPVWSLIVYPMRGSKTLRSPLRPSPKTFFALCESGTVRISVSRSLEWAIYQGGLEFPKIGTH